MREGQHRPSRPWFGCDKEVLLRLKHALTHLYLLPQLQSCYMALVQSFLRQRMRHIRRFLSISLPCLPPLPLSPTPQAGDPLVPAAAQCQVPP